MRVGFVGLGNMGRPMAMNLAKAGHEIVLYDSNDAALTPFAAVDGCWPASSLADVAACEAVVTMLPTGAIVRQTVTDPAFQAGLTPQTVIVDRSTSEPAGTRALAAELAAQGIALVDAPVSGGVPRATDGTLAIMTGADDKDALERVRPLLSAMGARIFDCGGSGAGHATKALNNVVAGSTFAALSEALIAARRFGLDESILIDVMDVSTGHSFMTQHVMKQQVIAGKYATGFALGLLVKDMKLAAEMAYGLDMKAPVITAALEKWQAARASLDYACDNTEAVKVWAEDA